MLTSPVKSADFYPRPIIRHFK